MRHWLEDSQPHNTPSRITCSRCIQFTLYSLQIHGASFQVFNYVRELEFEMNAANDNPLIFDEDDETLVISGGNLCQPSH